MTFIEFYEKIPYLKRGKKIMIRYFSDDVQLYTDYTCVMKNVSLHNDAIRVTNLEFINSENAFNNLQKPPILNKIFMLYNIPHENISIIDINYVRTQKLKKIMTNIKGK